MPTRAYLDYAASAPLRPNVAKAMLDFLAADQDTSCEWNANSLHSEGRRAFGSLEKSRLSVANALNVRPNEIFFTGSATEANNTALAGSALGAVRGSGNGTPHIVTSSIEHDSVYQVAHSLQSRGLADVTYVQPDRSGKVPADRIASALRENTVLASIMTANNETGAVNDIAAIGNACHAKGVLFHTDAVQALGKMPLDLGKLPVDMASFSAHKIGGPKGIGALYLKTGTKIAPYIVGGGQEGGYRSGTQNVLGALGFAAAIADACANAETLAEEVSRLMHMRDALYARLCSIDGVRASVACTEGSSDYLPNIVAVHVEDVESETLILRLDMEGVAVSGGSACSSRSLGPSRVLIETGIDRDSALGALRISIGFATTKDDIDHFLDAFSRILGDVKAQER